MYGAEGDCGRFKYPCLPPTSFRLVRSIHPRNSVEKGVSPLKRMDPSVRRKRPRGRLVVRKKIKLPIKWGVGGLVRGWVAKLGE
jgi:hypothetical protein